MRKFTRGFLTAGLAVLCGAAMALVAPGIAHADDGKCRDVSVPLTLPGLSIHGVFCQPTGSAKNVVQVLIPGGTYNQTYWNFPYKPEKYNFRLAMNKAGFATFTLDRLGTGGSSRPPSATVTPELQANAVHQVIQALRNGRLGQKFDKVILGGHSVGSVVAELEVATYQDVDGLLLTGSSHHASPVALASAVGLSMRPAMLDPKFSKGGYDPGYITTVPGSRAKAFYEPGKAEPGVAETDEATKDVASAAEAPEPIAVLSGLNPIQSRKINVPVMLANASRDPFMCGHGTDCSNADAMRRDESAYFSPAVRLHTYVLPGFGHDINFAPNAADYHRAVADWASSIT